MAFLEVGGKGVGSTRQVDGGGVFFRDEVCARGGYGDDRFSYVEAVHHF